MSSSDFFPISESTANWARHAGLATWHEKETTSTNAVAKEKPLSETPALELYVTDHQTAGRGRGGNQWNEGHWQQAQSSGALLSSWVFPRASLPSPVLSPLIGLAVMRAFHQTWPFLDWNLKAPNDLYLGSKKIAGLLIENVPAQDFHRFIVGLGVNVFTQPPLETATHLTYHLRECQPPIALTEKDWHSLLDRLLLEFTLVAGRSDQKLTATDSRSLLWALNRHPLLKERYLDVGDDCSLKTATKTIHWSEL
jgi:BirA family biotin operon repressor/biotin-[acetyl-CoA-carboxylase] ligase